MKTVLSIGAHPDDIEIGCGGTLALLKEKGYSLIHLIVTSGEQGHLFAPPEEIAKNREKEALASGAQLGTREVLFLREPDGLTTFTLETKLKMIEIIRRVAPDIIFTHSRYDGFPDHQVVRKLTDSALQGASGPWYPSAGGQPHKVKKVYGYEVWNPMNSFQVAFDITKFIEIKTEALRCHFSQISEVDYLAAVEGLARYRGVMSMKGRYAEVFEVVYSEEVL